MTAVKPLDPTSLYRKVDATQFRFKTTDDLKDLAEIIGQPRVLEALHFGVGIKQEGYNLYVLGPAGIGKYSVVRQYLDQQAAAAPQPDDWCYVHNFELPHKPKALRFPPSQGLAFHQEIKRLVDDLLHAMPLAYESTEYHSRVEAIQEQVKARREAAIQALTKSAEQQAITLVRTPSGYSFVPIKDGELVTPEEYDKLPPEKQQSIQDTVAELQDQLGVINHELPHWQREAREKIMQINREVAVMAVGTLIDDIKKKYTDLPKVVQYLEAFHQDVIDHADDFLSDPRQATGAALFEQIMDSKPFRRYQVNVLVQHSDNHGAPVVFEDNPNYEKMVGRIEHTAQLGALVTDFTMIKPGALHIANGGYLILDARKLMTSPFAWEGLKLALKSREICIQSLGQVLSLVSTTALEPEPIPIDLKVIVLGDRLLFYLLLEYDPEFAELFKVAADFEDSLERSEENNQLYAQLIATLVRRDHLLPFDVHAVARVLEYSARQAQDADKLSLHLRTLADLLCEADYWARQAQRQQVTPQDVETSIGKQVHRADRLRERVYEEIKRGTILINTDGATIGQVNGLSVADLGNFRFAQPFRITATVRLGEGEVLDIEREVELGGAIHSKGIMIIASLLGARYSAEQPLSMHASLVFEQTYGEIEGDSASVGELCALLSCLSGVPIRQNLAVTGSINQFGEVQAIGGVNEKIEGFFDVCCLKGLNGQQGVLIPHTNVNHLMLRHDVIEAARSGQFHIYPIQHVDEAIELLTGQTAGKPNARGKFPNGSINALVTDRLAHFADLRHNFGKDDPVKE